MHSRVVPNTITYCTFGRIAHLFQQQLAIGTKTRDQILGETKERTQYLRRKMIT